MPVTLGHEFSGVIEEVGIDVDDIKVGERVVVQPIIYDSTCHACKEGFINCCDKGGFLGLSGKQLNPYHAIMTDNDTRLGGRIFRTCGDSSKIRLQNSRFDFTAGGG